EEASRQRIENRGALVVVVAILGSLCVNYNGRQPSELVSDDEERRKPLVVAVSLQGPLSYFPLSKQQEWSSVWLLLMLPALAPLMPRGAITAAASLFAPTARAKWTGRKKESLSPSSPPPPPPLSHYSHCVIVICYCNHLFKLVSFQRYPFSLLS